ncbi:hypothetical protein B0H66DRAFT_530046 [Apodospora peruviana]|uniref:Ankyrin repeat protein n=1 Tax=Apodospora peruviana TaxID=516989 RepID=A0AAE0MB29_9PEZI|nr:hypothetical protein B0H66DRAFT_530046 [Apodospora peruviana]
MYLFYGDICRPVVLEGLLTGCPNNLKGRYSNPSEASIRITNTSLDFFDLFGGGLAPWKRTRTFSERLNSPRSFYCLFNLDYYRRDARSALPRAMIWGAAAGSIITMERTFIAGADVNQPGHPSITLRELDGMKCPHIVNQSPEGTPLHYAAQNNKFEAVEWLLSHGARVDAPSQRMCKCGEHLNHIAQAYIVPTWYAHHTALCHCHLDIVKLLVSRGGARADDCRDLGDDDAFSRAMAASTYPEKGDTTLLHTAARPGHYQIL